ncbi:MAG: M56 family metallopeptidase, partial [Eubacteriales bacterium]|nr:M56 family metallopeptidase [Eubacteriales bacterium]
MAIIDKLFLTILNMGLTGAFIIAAICVARLPLKKAPKIITYCLWVVAGFRLVFPFSIESVFSFMPFKAQTLPLNIAMQPIPRIDSGISFINNAVSSIFPAAAPAASVTPLQIWTAIGAWVWLVGVAVLLIYGVISFFILKRKMSESAHSEANIYEAENMKSPFVLGIFKPRIYLPVGLSEQEKTYVILHEQTHINRHDHIIKFAAYFVVCLHWFNPFAWVAFLLMGVDMEMSCDERVLKEMGGEIINDYSLSLLSLATERRILGGSPLAFGEGGVKARIKNVQSFKKPSRVIIVAAVALVVVLSAGFAVNRIVNAPLIEMKMVYEENPAFFFKDMKLVWGDTVYYATPMNNTGRGNEIGYATDEISTWRIYELKGYNRDYLLAVESEDVWRVMTSHLPVEPWRQYILENVSDRQKAECMLSVTLYNDGKARLAIPPISSYAMTEPVYYSFENDELLIGYNNNNFSESTRSEPFARFEVVDDNTIIFRSATIPLFADEGARYHTAIVPEILEKVYLGMPCADVYDLFGEPDFQASGLMWFGYNNVGVFDPGWTPGGVIGRIQAGGKDWSVFNLIIDAIMQKFSNGISAEEYSAVWYEITALNADANGFTVEGTAQYERYLPDGEYNVRRTYWEYSHFTLTYTKNTDFDYVLASSDMKAGWIWGKLPELRCYDAAMYHFVGAVPSDGRYGIGVGTAAVTNVADCTTDGGGFIIRYFPGATVQIEEYNVEWSAYEPQNWIIEYAD